MRDLLVVGAFPLYALYAGNGLSLSSADNLATRRIASQLVTHGTLDLARDPPYEESFGWAAVTIHGRVLSAYPVGIGLLQVPYAAAALAGSAGSITYSLVARWEKHFAGLLTVASSRSSSSPPNACSGVARRGERPADRADLRHLERQ